MGLLQWVKSLLQGEESEPSATDAAAEASRRPANEAGRSSAGRHVTVGIDFGTSSTKVVFQDWTKDPYAVDFGVELPGYSRFSRPSLIALEDGGLLFGERAVDASDRGGASVLRSAKVELLDDRVDSPPLEVPWKLPPGLEARGVSTLEGLVTLFLADTIRRASWIAARLYPSLPLSEIAFNLDVPVSGLDDGPVAARFQRMLDVAIPLSRQLRDEMEASEALGRWEEVLEEVLDNPPPEGDRPGELVPESEAIIQGVGSALDAGSSDLYHAIVDIGAGTTDIGWFKLVRRRTEDRLPFFAAETKRVGGDDVDEHLARQIANGSSSTRRALQAQLVRMKPDLVGGEECAARIDGHLIDVHPEDLERAAEHVAPDVYGHYSDTFGPAYKKEKNTDRWERIRTILVGGGSLLPALRAPFEQHPRQFGQSAELIDVSGKTKLEAAGASNQPPTREEVPFLIAALGLSFPKAVMPEPMMPSEIDDDDGPPGPTGPYDDPVPFDYE